MECKVIKCRPDDINYINPRIEIVFQVSKIPYNYVVYQANANLKLNDSNKTLASCNGLISNEQDLLPNQESKPIDITFSFSISKKALKEIDLYRKRNDNTKGEVIFEIYALLSIISSTIDIQKMVGRIEKLEQARSGDSSQESSFKARIIPPNNEYGTLLKLIPLCELRCEHKIDGNTWLYDFSPKLGAGEYEIIEFPKLKMEDANEKFKVALNFLEEARKNLYALNVGPSLTSLRGSIEKFNSVLVQLGYPPINKKRTVPNYKEIFTDNKNIADLACNLQHQLYTASSTSQYPGTPHGPANPEGSNGDSGEKYIIERYEVESMISMAYSLYKMVFERLKSIENEKGGCD